MKGTIEDLKTLREVLVSQRRAAAYLLVPGQQPDRVALLANLHLAVDAVEEVIEEGLAEDGADAKTKVSGSTGRAPKASR
jgi:hypothetical protein